MLSGHRGAAPLDAIVGTLILMLIALAAIQVALVVYAQNAVRASAYEAARAAAEVGGSGERAQLVAARTLSQTAGKLVDRIRISVDRRSALEGPVVRVEITARQRSIGPIPISLPIRASATALLEVVARR